ncbi:putative rRNA-processing protein fcf2 [Xylariales sp. AK1849]|nr:putative rRNA-processing protein fcf2 [Xylariales sp. AK1849]
MEDTAVDLNDEQIEKLLQEAEARLSAKANGRNGTSLTIPSKMEVVKNIDDNATVFPIEHTKKKISTEELSVRISHPRLSKQEYAKQAKATAGPAWFDLPKTDLTPALKADLQLLKMRGTLDNKRFYKKDNSRLSVPEYSHVGTLIEGPTEYFSARMTKKERKRTLLEEVLETEDTTRKFKSKYGEIQAAKTSGKKAHYKKMTQKRYGSKR